MIARKPTPKETQAQRFIQSTGNGNGTTPKRDMREVLMGFDRGLLERVDRMAQSMGLSRTAFVVNAVAEKLMQLEARA
jgi:hypothetical protein